MRKFGFPIVSAETRQRKNVGCRKIQHRSITTLPIQLSNKQTDPANAFVENERHKLRNAFGNGECRTCFEKIQKLQLFPPRTGRKKNRQKLSQHACQLKALPSYSAKKLASPSSLFRQGSKEYTLLSRKSENCNFYSPQLTGKKIRRPEVWNMMDQGPYRSV